MSPWISSARRVRRISLQRAGERLRYIKDKPTEKTRLLRGTIFNSRKWMLLSLLRCVAGALSVYETHTRVRSKRDEKTVVRRKRMRAGYKKKNVPELWNHWRILLLRSFSSCGLPPASDVEIYGRFKDTLLFVSRTSVVRLLLLRFIIVVLVGTKSSTLRD